MRNYTIKTHADQAFYGNYGYVNVIDSHYEGDGKIQVLDIEVDEADEWRYQRELEMDPAVISFVCNDVFEDDHATR